MEEPCVHSFVRLLARSIWNRRRAISFFTTAVSLTGNLMALSATFRCTVCNIVRQLALKIYCLLLIQDPPHLYILPVLFLMMIILIKSGFFDDAPKHIMIVPADHLSFSYAIQSGSDVKKELDGPETVMVSARIHANREQTAAQTNHHRRRSSLPREETVMGSARLLKKRELDDLEIVMGSAARLHREQMIAVALQKDHHRLPGEETVMGSAIKLHKNYELNDPETVMGSAKLHKNGELDDLETVMGSAARLHKDREEMISVAQKDHRRLPAGEEGSAIKLHKNCELDDPETVMGSARLHKNRGQTAAEKDHHSGELEMIMSEGPAVEEAEVDVINAMIINDFWNPNLESPEEPEMFDEADDPETLSEEEQQSIEELNRRVEAFILKVRKNFKVERPNQGLQ